VIRVFNVYYPLRTLILLAGEAVIVWLSFIAGTRLQNQDWWLVLNVEGGYLKILVVTAAVLLISHWLDLYDSSGLDARWEQVFRLLLVLGLVALALSAVEVLAPHFFPGNGSALTGLIILTFMLFTWRAGYSWLVRQPYLRERVYVLGTGERAQRLVNGLRQRSALGIEVVGWTGNIEGALTRERVASHLLGLAQQNGVHRVIVAMPDRRGTLPVEELLDLRLAGVRVEEAASWLEKISGRIEVDQLYPSWLIFAEGFRFSNLFRLVRRFLNFSFALLGLLFSLPLLPFIMLAIKLDSPGPVLYHQNRVGRRGETFYCYKFRTMRQDAEADSGATWAADDDPRITRIGKFLRKKSLDEFPQLYNVLRGEMSLVGPRPLPVDEVKRFSDPAHRRRLSVKPGLTCLWQISGRNDVSDFKDWVRLDLEYIDNWSLWLDLKILWWTVPVVFTGVGAK